MAQFTDSELSERLEEAVEELRWLADGWEDGVIPLDAAPTSFRTTARAYDSLGSTAALLGAVAQARAWYGQKAVWYQKCNEAARLRRDMCAPSEWKNEPGRFTRALNAAILSRDDGIIEAVATSTLAMDEKYMEEWGDERPLYAAQYFHAKIKAALVSDDEPGAAQLARLEAAVDRLADANQFWPAVVDYYRSLLGGSPAATQEAVEEIFADHASEYPDPDSTRRYVLDTVCAYVVLARRYGIDVAVDSARVSDALVREGLPADDIHLEVDLSGLELCSAVGLFELSRDGGGSPVIAARMYHPGGEPVSAADIPDRADGRLLTDAWIEAALTEAEWREQYDDDLVADARAAFADGTLVRKLIVVQDRTDGTTFEDSMTDLSIDEIELLKGAVR